MEKELKIEVPQGYEIDKQKSTFEKIIFKKIPENPKSWEEYCEQTKGCLYNCWNPYDEPHIRKTIFEGFYNEFPTRERVEQFVALGKLLQLRDYWVKGYNEFRYALFWTKVGITICDNSKSVSYSLTFPTKEMAYDFKNCFEDLIKKAFPLALIPQHYYKIFFLST